MEFFSVLKDLPLYGLLYLLLVIVVLYALYIVLSLWYYADFEDRTDDLIYKIELSSTYSKNHFLRKRIKEIDLRIDKCEFSFLRMRRIEKELVDLLEHPEKFPKESFSVNLHSSE